MSILLIYFATFFWAVDTLIRYPLSQFISPNIIVLIEHLFLVIIFSILLWLKEKKRISFNKEVFLPFLVIGVLGSGLSTVAFTKAFSLISPTTVILLQKLQPFFVILFSRLILKERFEKKFFMYALIGMIGAFLISFPDVGHLFRADHFTGFSIGYVLTFVAIIGWSSSTVFAKKLNQKNLSELEILNGRFSYGLVFLIVYSLFFAEYAAFKSLDYFSVVKILVMVLISGALGMYLYYLGIKHLSAHIAAIAELFFPLNAVIINWLFLDQKITAIQFLGIGLLIWTSIRLQKIKKLELSN